MVSIYYRITKVFGLRNVEECFVGVDIAILNGLVWLPLGAAINNQPVLVEKSKISLDVKHLFLLNHTCYVVAHFEIHKKIHHCSAWHIYNSYKFWPI